MYGVLWSADMGFETNCKNESVESLELKKDSMIRYAARDLLMKY